MKDMKLSHISTNCLIRMLLRHAWMIVLSAAIFYMAASLYFDTLWTPRYESSMTYAVRPRTTTIYNSSSSATREVASVLSNLLPSNMVTEKIRTFDGSTADYNGVITATQVGNSNLVVVTCQDDSPGDTLLALLALEEIMPNLMNYVSSNAVLMVVHNPSVSDSMVNAVDISRATRAAALAGAVLMAALLVFLFLRRQTVQTRTGAHDLLDAGVIASVPRVYRRLSLQSLLRPVHTALQVFSPATNFAYSEQINTICTRLEHEHQSTGARLFLFTSVSENEGKSTISGNVAAALAMRGSRVAVLDCDLRNPSQKAFFDNHYNAQLPLNELLAQPFSQDNLDRCKMYHKKLGLYMLFSHEPDRRCTELLTGHTLRDLLSQLSDCDYVILDTPPMGYFTDTEAILDKVDGSILVVRQDRTPARDINDHIDVLRAARSRFLGLVLNDMTGSLTEGYGYGYYGHYGYGRQGRHQAHSR